MEKRRIQAVLDKQQPIKTKRKPVIDISYVEIPDRITCRITLSDVFGAISFCSIILAPAAVEENPVLALVLTAACGIFAYFSIKENGPIK